MSVEAEREVSTSPHCEQDRMANIATAILSENFGRLLRPVRRLLLRRCPEHRSRHTLLRPLQQTLPEWMMSQSGSDVHALSLSHGPGPVRRSMRLQHSLKPKVLTPLLPAKKLHRLPDLRSHSSLLALTCTKKDSNLYTWVASRLLFFPAGTWEQ